MRFNLSPMFHSPNRHHSPYDVPNGPGNHEALGRDQPSEIPEESQGQLIEDFPEQERIDHPEYDVAPGPPGQDVPPAEQEAGPAREALDGSVGQDDGTETADQAFNNAAEEPTDVRIGEQVGDVGIREEREATGEKNCTLKETVKTSEEPTEVGVPDLVRIHDTGEANEGDIETPTRFPGHPPNLTLIVTHPHALRQPTPSEDHQEPAREPSDDAAELAGSLRTTRLPLVYQENPFVPEEDGVLPFAKILAEARSVEGITGRVAIAGDIVTVPPTDTDPGRRLHYELDVARVQDGRIVGYQGDDRLPDLALAVSHTGSSDGIRAEVDPYLQAIAFDFSRRSLSDMPIGSEPAVVQTLIEHFEALGCTVNHIQMSAPLAELRRQEGQSLQDALRETPFGRLYTGLGFSIGNSRIVQGDNRQLTLYANFSKPRV